MEAQAGGSALGQPAPLRWPPIEVLPSTMGALLSTPRTSRCPEHSPSRCNGTGVAASRTLIAMPGHAGWQQDPEHNNPCHLHVIQLPNYCMRVPFNAGQSEPAQATGMRPPGKAWRNMNRRGSADSGV